ncbi:ankyrin repeat domain-containing protein [Endozoicomonadaceae bacterium StTr2]
MKIKSLLLLILIVFFNMPVSTYAFYFTLSPAEQEALENQYTSNLQPLVDAILIEDAETIESYIETYSAYLVANCKIGCIIQDTDGEESQHDLITAYWLCCRSGLIRIIETLQDSKININERDIFTGQTALMVAAHEGHDDVVAHLLKHNADPNKLDALKNTVDYYCTVGDLKSNKKRRMQRLVDEHRVLHRISTPVEAIQYTVLPAALRNQM